jgi:hypothetical protein
MFNKIDPDEDKIYLNAMQVQAVSVNANRKKLPNIIRINTKQNSPCA